jgi:hypothetical protein
VRAILIGQVRERVRIVNEVRHGMDSLGCKKDKDKDGYRVDKERGLLPGRLPAHRSPHIKNGIPSVKTSVNNPTICINALGLGAFDEGNRLLFRVKFLYCSPAHDLTP